MIEQTKGPSPQTATEPQGAAATARQTAATPFQALLTNGNGEVFELPPAWGSYKPEVKPSAAPVEVQIAAVDDGWRDDAAAAAAPAPQRRPAEQAPAFDGNGEAAFVPPNMTDEVRSAAVNKGHVHAFAEGNEPTVWDFIDLINPLQHIPVVNWVYRELTGDKIGAVPQIVGGAVLGGAVGGFAAVANVILQEATGKDVGGHVVAMLNGGDAAAPAGETRLADTAPPAPAETAVPRGHIEVTAPTPPAIAAPPSAPPSTATAVPASKNFVPYVNAPAHALPDAQAAAQAAKTKSGSKFKPVPARSTPTAPVSASALAAPSPDAVKRAAAVQGLKNSSHPLVNPNPTEDAASADALTAPAPARRAVSASDSLQPEAAPANTADFVAKFMTAMDKYDKAGRLAAAQAAAIPAAAKK